MAAESGEAVLAGVTAALPVRLGRFDPAAQRSGLIVVDEVNGFATPGCGPLAPPGPDAAVGEMIAETDRVARRFEAAGWPILAFLDTHEPDRPEPPYPPHCLRGTGHEDLVPDLAWLGGVATLVRKDCINGYIGAADPDGGNRLTAWIAAHDLTAVVVVGICTDICVMDLVLTLLSARNHGLAGGLRDIVVYEPACATYDLPLSTALSLGLPAPSAHPRALTHHLGLYFMASRGAILADGL